MEKERIIVGIDYGIQSPAVTIHIGNEWKFSNCKFYYLTDRKKSLGHPNKQFIGTEHKDYKTQEERIDNISEWAISPIVERCPNVENVFIEDYAFAAHGRVFALGENCGLLKYKLWKLSQLFHLVAPPTVKKFASGKGNAQKLQMYDAFFEDTKFDLHQLLGTLGLQNLSPTSDIVDSYFIAKWGFYYRNKAE